MPISDGPNETAVEALQSAAQAYCDAISSCNRIDKADFVRLIHLHLAAVHAGLVALPPSRDIHPEDAAVTSTPAFLSETAALALAYPSLVRQLGDHRYYREVFDPWELDDDRAMTGDLTDDLWDTFMGLRTGLDLWNRGRRDQALWQWRFGFESHWGEHVTGALRALYMLARRREEYWG